MAQFQFSDVHVPIIIQDIGGDLRVRGRAGSVLTVEGEGAHAELLGEGQPYVVRSDGEARITIPDDVAISVQTVGGAAKVTEIGGDVDIQTVGGDLVVRNTGSANIKTVGGDLRVKRIEGNVTIETVGADATVRDVSGSVWVATVGEDLYVRNIDGSCKIEQVGTELVVSIDFVAGQDYHFKAGTDVLCRIQPDTDARFIVPLDTEVSLDIAAELVEDDEQDRQIITIGEGSATVIIEEANELRLVGEDENYMLNFGVQIEEELEARLSSLEEKLSRQLEGLDERIQSKTAQFASQAERFAERAQRQAERAAERMRRSLERQGRKRKPGPRRVTMAIQHDDAPSKRKNDEPVSEQERLLILKMVQENKISIEEAERLLAALDS